MKSGSCYDRSRIDPLKLQGGLRSGKVEKDEAWDNGTYHDGMLGRRLGRDAAGG